MSEDKLYPPSDLKLKRLREAGVVPFSRDLMTAGVVIGLAAAVPAFVLYHGAVLIDFTRESFSAHADAGLDRFAGQFWGLTAALLWPVIVLLALIGGLQTRFLFTLKPLTPNFLRFFSSPNILAGFGTRLGNRFAGGFKAAAIIALGTVLIYRYFFEPLADAKIAREAAQAADALFQNDGAQMSEPPARLLWASVLGGSPMLSLLFGLAGGALFIGIVSWLTSLVTFRLAQGMTRAELEAEYREQEVSPEIRQARKEQLLS